MRVPALVILFVAVGGLAGAQTPPVPFPTRTPPPIFNGTDLAGWKVEYTKADVRDGALHVGSGNGWVRSERVYADFVLTMDVKLDAKAEAGIFVRAWPTFSDKQSPTNGYRLTLQPNATSDDWTHVEVECAGRTITVRANGSVVHMAEALENPQGHVALWATDKTAQFRAIQIVSRPFPSMQAPPGVALAGAGVVNPRPLNRTTPNYTAAAMRAKITGTVTLAGTVMPDGSVTDVTVLQSLDPKHGLDDRAIATAQAWRFEPGTRGGEPVPVRIMIQFAFNLR